MMMMALADTFSNNQLGYRSALYIVISIIGFRKKFKPTKLIASIHEFDECSLEWKNFECLNNTASFLNSY